MAKCTLLVGQIACGKSTYTKSLDAVRVNDDDLVAALSGGYDETLEPLYKTVETSILTSAFSLGRDVVIDRPCHKRATRRRYIALAKTFAYTVHIVEFERRPYPTAGARRYLDDSRGLSLYHWLKAAERHERAYEPPNEILEGFDSYEFIPA